LTLPIADVLPVTARARVVKIDLEGRQFPFQPGQALMLAAHGWGQRRAYSVAVAPEDVTRNGMLELLIGVDAHGSPGPHLKLEAGALVDVDGPIGRFILPESPQEQRFVFIAGGTGIAPLRAMLRRALNGPSREIALLYSARTPSDFVYEAEMHELARGGRIELRQTVTRNAATDGWSGARGRIGRDDLAPLVHPASTLCFVCGPPAMVAEIRSLLSELGVPHERVRIEESIVRPQPRPVQAPLPAASQSAAS
jgi:NAD(P)H-flavin reductase